MGPIHAHRYAPDLNPTYSDLAGSQPMDRQLDSENLVTPFDIPKGCLTFLKTYNIYRFP
jgi:hypothetical protein